LCKLAAQIVELTQLVSTMVEYKMATDSKFAATISYDEKARIMNNGYVGGLNNGYQAAFM
jgi:N-acetylglucosamine-6-phosphate deacetylase